MWNETNLRKINSKKAEKEAQRKVFFFIVLELLEFALN